MNIRANEIISLFRIADIRTESLILNYNISDSLYTSLKFLSISITHDDFFSTITDVSDVLELFKFLIHIVDTNLINIMRMYYLCTPYISDEIITLLKPPTNELRIIVNSCISNIFNNAYAQARIIYILQSYHELIDYNILDLLYRNAKNRIKLLLERKYINEIALEDYKTIINLSEQIYTKYYT